jgi:hypothetical protein
MTKVTVEEAKFAMAQVRKLKPRHQIPAAARILGVHEGTIRNRLKKKGPKKQYKRRIREITSNEIERVVDVPDIRLKFDPNDMVIAALRDLMGDEMPEEFA